MSMIQRLFGNTRQADLATPSQSANLSDPRMSELEALASTRRELVRVMTRDTQRAAGIPDGWLEVHVLLEPSRSQTFVHLRYSYGYGMAGRLAMQGYLATVGADKIGFTVTGRNADGQPQYIGGVRGAVERNAMRYYLASDAYLDSLGLPAGQQAEKRIQNWFTESERYPRQLREMDRTTYVAMKRQEVERQQTLLQ